MGSFVGNGHGRPRAQYAKSIKDCVAMATQQVGEQLAPNTVRCSSISRPAVVGIRSPTDFLSSCDLVSSALPLGAVVGFVVGLAVGMYVGDVDGMMVGVKVGF